MHDRVHDSSLANHKPRYIAKYISVIHALDLARFDKVSYKIEKANAVRNLRTVCRKDRLTVYKIEKIDFLKICQNKGLGKLVHKIDLSDRLEVYLFFDEFFSFCPWKPAKFTPKSALL